MPEYESRNFNQHLSLKESGGRYSVVNASGFVGRYQLGQTRLEDFNRVFRTNHSVHDFLQSPTLQEEVQHWHVSDIDRFIDKAGLTAFIGEDFQGVALSRGSLRAVAHLGGKNGLRRFLLSKGNYDPADANGTRLSDYALAFANVQDRPVQAGVARHDPSHTPEPFDPSHVVYPKEAVEWARRDNGLGRHLPIGEAEGLKFRADARNTPDQLTDIIAWLDVARSERYRAAGGKTFCNVYASDYCYLSGAYLPRVWGMGRPASSLKTEISHKASASEMTANALFDWLPTYGGHFGWVQLESLDELQKGANRGCCSLIIAKSVPNRHGHISIICPETAAVKAGRQSDTVIHPVQSQTALEGGMVSDKTDWWDRPEFTDVAFWINDRSTLRGEALKGNWLVSALTRVLSPQDCAALDATLAVYRDEVQRMPEVPAAFFDALVAGEDKRFFRHPGFDVMAMFRALHRRVTRRKIEGASTIEQQLVRTITGHRDRTLRRKLSEILLAMRCSSALDKKTIALIYLNNAYFGWRATGLRDALRRPEFMFETEAETAANLTASLRYPVAKSESDTRRRTRARRVEFILKRMG